MIRRSMFLVVLAVALPLGGFLAGPTLGPALHGLSLALFQPAPTLHILFHRHGPHPR